MLCCECAVHSVIVSLSSVCVHVRPVFGAIPPLHAAVPPESRATCNLESFFPSQTRALRPEVEYVSNIKFLDS